MRGRPDPHRLLGTRAATRSGGDGRIDAWPPDDDQALHFTGPDGVGGRVRVACATGFAERLRGLIGRSPPPPGHGLWIEPCAAVHTFGVREAIDLAFVSACMVVQRVDGAVPPRRVRIEPGVRAVLELRAGEAARIGLRAGVRLEWRIASRALECRGRPIRGGCR